MKRVAKVVILVAAPLLTAAIWLDKQPSYKPYQAPVLVPPAGSVPLSGKELVPQEKNPVAPTEVSLAAGKALFETNCVMCHGKTSADRGPVGKKLVPPPPALDHDMVGGLTDATIFTAITKGFGRMPPFKDKLTPRERWELVDFLRTRR